jgi:hypothetical protein
MGNEIYKLSQIKAKTESQNLVVRGKGNGKGGHGQEGLGFV